MKRDTLLLLGLGALLFIGGSVFIMSDWKKRGAKFLPMLNAAEVKYGIPKDVLARQAYQESRFRDDIISGAVKSSAGAVGIMQIVPKWHPTVDPLSVSESIDYAARFLRDLKLQFGTWALALAAYNAGPGNVRKYGNTVPPFPETQAYVRDILTGAGYPLTV